ncbi:MAG: hypothetical protein B7Z82_08450, partial [Halothiobacillus sp. 20-54-6]
IDGAFNHASRFGEQAISRTTDGFTVIDNEDFKPRESKSTCRRFHRMFHGDIPSSNELSIEQTIRKISNVGNVPNVTGFGNDFGI